MATYSTINGLTNRATLATTDEFEVQVSGETSTKKALLSVLKTLFFGTAVIGGNAAGDIITTNGTQTLTNKTLTSPTIGTAATLPAATTIGTVTAAELLKLAGLTPSTAELNYVDGVTSAIQTQLDTIAATAGGIVDRTYCYGATEQNSGTSRSITEATILTACGVSSAYRMNPTTLSIQVYEVVTGTYTQLDVSAGCGIRYRNVNDAYGLHVATVDITGLTNLSYYNVVITFKIYAIPT